MLLELLLQLRFYLLADAFLLHSQANELLLLLLEALLLRHHLQQHLPRLLELLLELLYVVLQQLHELLGFDLAQLYLLASIQPAAEAIAVARYLSGEVGILELCVFELLLELPDLLLHGFLICLELVDTLEVVL